MNDLDHLDVMLATQTLPELLQLAAKVDQHIKAQLDHIDHAVRSLFDQLLLEEVDPKTATSIIRKEVAKELQSLAGKYIVGYYVHAYQQAARRNIMDEIPG